MITEQDKQNYREVLAADASVFLTYSLSEAFDWDRHGHLLRLITKIAIELNEHLHAYDEAHSDDLKFGAPQ